MSYLDVQGLSKRFGGQLAVDRCTFKVERNGITCLIGSNGAGKTTIFNTITGFLHADAGHVQFNGRPVTGMTPQALVKLGVARSFQNLRLLLESSVLDNVLLAVPDLVDESPWGAFTTPLFGATRRKRRSAGEAAMAALKEVGIAHRAHDVTKNLSYGEQKLLCVARLLATGADLLMLDEPASGLDAEALDAVILLLKRLVAEGKTLVVIEHNVKLVKKIATDVVFLHQGHVMAQGDADSVISRADLTEIYFGGGAVRDL